MPSSTPAEVVRTLLSNTLNSEVVREVITPEATYVPLNYDNPDLTKILPYAGSHKQFALAGPQAIIDTFDTVDRIWARETFEIQTLFDIGEDVAVFGRFTNRSRSLGQVSVSPFSVWCKVDEEKKITYMQFMEDALGSTDSFKKGGQNQYVVFEEKGEIEV